MAVNLQHIHKSFDTQQKCIAYLEQLRWKGKPVSPFTGSEKVYKRKDSIMWHCNDTNKDFSVLHGTIFEASKFPLPQWFILIALMLNAKKGISSMELMRNLGCAYATAWYCAMRVRCAMVESCLELQNIVEIDETYSGGKPRKPNNVADISTFENKRGRGTSKAKIVGIVERNGKIILQVVDKINSQVLLSVLKRNANIENTIVVTDELPAYKAFDDLVQHLTINHKKQFSKGIVHTNTIEGFWSIVKNSIRGQYISLSKKYLPIYLVQAQYIYNTRNDKSDLFADFLKSAVNSEKEFLHYVPKRDIKKIVYKARKEAKC